LCKLKTIVVLEIFVAVLVKDKHYFTGPMIREKFNTLVNTYVHKTLRDFTPSDCTAGNWILTAARQSITLQPPPPGTAEFPHHPRHHRR